MTVRKESRAPQVAASAAPTSSRESSVPVQPQQQDGPGADVWVHIYHCDPYTGFLNRTLLAHQEIGIYHAGIEVFGEEWSFQYYEDTWNDPSVSGLVYCLPKQMQGYEYRESVNLGPTPLSQDEVQELVVALHEEWPSCSYHLTHNNCLTFAERFSERLHTPERFPQWPKGILEASNKNASVDAIVDYSWSWVKWWMIRKHLPVEEPCKKADSPVLCKEQLTAGLWGLFNFESTCSGNLCPGNPGKTGVVPGVDVATRAHFAQGASRPLVDEA